MRVNRRHVLIAAATVAAPTAARPAPGPPCGAVRTAIATGSHRPSRDPRAAGRDRQPGAARRDARCLAAARAAADSSHRDGLGRGLPQPRASRRRLRRTACRQAVPPRLRPSGRPLGRAAATATRRQPRRCRDAGRTPVCLRRFHRAEPHPARRGLRLRRHALEPHPAAAEACGAMSCIAVGDRIHLVGGAIGSEWRRSIDWHVVYDPASDSYSGGSRCPLRATTWASLPWPARST